ncbi:lipopolysaccharide biosynthesis protein [Numidum massiliense]|uniref:lipopolysaccharide biosynthesis protein n=1 Tax=Numidum massiliense TaxID=1522315 RepID=UPI0006D598F2|nr:oligosaccharide flippase family protein [Numidum massiliense]
MTVVLKDSILLSGHRLAKSISQLVITMILARVLTKGEMGIYQQILIITVTLSSFIPFELPTSFSYFFNKTNEKKQQQSVIANTFFTLFVLGLVTFLVLMLLYDRGWMMAEHKTAGFSLWVALWCSAMISGSYLENLYVSTKRAKTFSLFMLLYYVGYFATIVAVTLMTQDLLLIVQLTALWECARVIALHVIFNRVESLSLRLNLPLLKEQVSYTLVVGAVTAANVLTLFTDKILVNSFYPLEQFAVFSIASKEIPFVYTVTVSVVTAMLPKLSAIFNVERSPERTLKMWVDASKALAVIIFPLFWVLLFYNRAFIEIVYSASYLEGAGIFIIYLLKFPLSFTVFYTLLLVSGKQKLVLKNAVIVVVVNLLLSVVMMFAFGIVGIAVATVLTAYLGIYLQQKDVCKVFAIKQRELLPYGMIAKTFLLSGATTLVIYTLFSFLPIDHRLAFVLGGTLAMIGYVALAFYRKDLDVNVLLDALRRKQNRSDQQTA